MRLTAVPEYCLISKSLIAIIVYAALHRSRDVPTYRQAAPRSL